VVEQTIKTRCVISIGDYDPNDATEQFARFLTELQRFSTTWNVTARYSPVRTEANGIVAVWNTESRATNWTVNTEFRLLNWSDIFKNDFHRWTFRRAWHVIRALTDFTISGTCFRYLLKSWRFGLLFLYPVLTTLLFTILALWLGALFENLHVPLPFLVGLTIGAGLFAAFIKWLDPFGLPRIVDMWVILYNFAHLERTDFAERLRIFTQEITAKLQSNDFNEIIVVGHGIGAALQPIVMDQAFWALPDFGKDGRSVSLLSLGSLLLAVELHPEGAWLGPPVSRLALDRMVHWVDYQAEDDIFSLPGTSSMGDLADGRGKPAIQKIRIADLIDTTEKRRFSQTAYQIHMQLVRANSKRYLYDYFMICCGPIGLSTRVKFRDRMVDIFASDGSLVFDN
jgi:hypothetical protein